MHNKTLPKDVTYEKLVSNIKSYLQPKVSVVAERSEFRNSVNQTDNIYYITIIIMIDYNLTGEIKVEFKKCMIFNKSYFNS